MPDDGRPGDSATELAFLQALREIKTHYRHFIWESQLWTQVGPHRSPYRSMILFGLSARTRDKLLVETCRRFFLHFPDALSLMEQWPAQRPVTESIVRKGQIAFIESLAANLKVWGGELPKDKTRLLEIVGVGEKIAECVLAYGWGIEALPLDGNGCRLNQRLMGLPDLAKQWDAALIRDTLKETFRKHRRWMDNQEISMVDIHELLRLHSQLICGKGPDCQNCPVTRYLSRRREFLGCDPPEHENLWNDWRELILAPEE